MKLTNNKHVCMILILQPPLTSPFHLLEQAGETPSGCVQASTTAVDGWMPNGPR